LIDALVSEKNNFFLFNLEGFQNLQGLIAAKGQYKKKPSRLQDGFYDYS
jgi:hypothetical protein